MRRCRLGIQLAVVTLAAATASAAASDLADILARSKAAAGGDAWDAVAGLHVEAAVAVGGLEGEIEGWEDVRTCRSASAFELGPIHGREGFDGEAVWTQDRSGQVHLDDAGGARERAANQAWLRCLAYWYPERWPAEIGYSRYEDKSERSFHVLAVHPEGGRPFELWIDAFTYLVDRTVDPSDREVRTDTYSDYRDVEAVGGATVRVAFGLRSSNGQEQFDQVVTLQRVEARRELDDELFKIPEPAVDDFTIAGDAASTVLGFELLNNHIYVEAAINGEEGFRLLVDTGGANVLTPKAVKRLGLEGEGSFEVRGVGEQTEEMSLAEVERLRLGEAEIRDQVFFVIDMSALYDVEGVDFDGLVGFEVFKRFVVTIDYEGSRLVLTRPGAFDYGGAGKVIPFTFDGHTPQVRGAVDGHEGLFAIDTGSRSSLTLHGPFAAESGLGDKFASAPQVLSGWGVGGGVRARVARAGVLRLGKEEIPAPVMNISEMETGAFAGSHVAGNVGGGILKRFTVTFDYGEKRMILERNGLYGRADTYDRAGLWLNRDGDAFAVMDVTPDGPAEGAGLRAGDRVVAIDGRPASELSLPSVRERLRGGPVGAEVRLTVEGGEGGKREVVLRLRELI